jgi:hypothetical protein
MKVSTPAAFEQSQSAPKSQPNNKKQDIIETKNNNTIVQYILTLFER